MGQIYKEQATITPTQETQKLADISGLENIADTMQQTYDKQIETYAKEQVNIGSQAIESAYESFPNDPTEFDKTVAKSMSDIEESIEDPNAKATFRSEMKLKGNPKSAKVRVNFQNNVDKQHKDSIKFDAEMTLSSVKNDISLFFTNDPAVADVKANLGRLVEQGQAKDKDGFILPVGDRAKITDLADNPVYYGALAWADEMKAKDNVEALNNEYKQLLNNDKLKKQLGAGRYTKLLEAFKTGKSGNALANAQNEAGFDFRVKSIKLDAGGVPEGISRGKLNGLIGELEESAINKEITPAFYKTNATKLKVMSVKLDRAELGIKEGDTKGFLLWKNKEVSIEENLWKTLDVSFPADGNNDREVERYNLSHAIYNKLKEKGVDPESYDLQNNMTASDITFEVIGKYTGQYYSQYTKGLDLTTKEGQAKAFVNIAQAEAQAKTQTLLGLDKDLDEYLKVPNVVEEEKEPVDKYRNMNADQKAFYKRQDEKSEEATEAIFGGAKDVVEKITGGIKDKVVGGFARGLSL